MIFAVRHSVKLALVNELINHAAFLCEISYYSYLRMACTLLDKNFVYCMSRFQRLDYWVSSVYNVFIHS